MRHWTKPLSLFLVLTLIFTYFPGMGQQVFAAEDGNVYVTAMSYPQNAGQVKSQSEPEWSDMVQEYANVGSGGQMVRYLNAQPADGYKFVEWRKNGVWQGSDRQLSILIKPDSEGDVYTAVFAEQYYGGKLSSIDFGTANTGYSFSSTSQRRVIFFRNTGSDDLVMDMYKLTLTGTNADSFNCLKQGSAGRIRPGRSTNVGWITPKDGLSAGTYRATLNFESYDGNVYVTAPVTFTVTGSSTQRYLVNVVGASNGMASASPTSGVSGTTVTLTADPDPGYQLKEWTVDSGGVTVSNNKFTFGTRDVRIAPVFEKKDVTTHTVTFDTQGGCYVPSQTVEHGKKAEQPADPRKPNNYFDNWYDSADYAHAWYYSFNTAIYADTTVYAGWNSEIQACAYDKTNRAYMAGGQIRYESLDPKTYVNTTINSQMSAELTALPYSGYRFVEWREGVGLGQEMEDCTPVSTGTSYTIHPTEHRSVYAVFEEIPAEPTQITEFHYYIDEPVADQAPDPMISVYTVPSGGFTQSEYPAVWYESSTDDLDDFTEMTSPVFEAGKYYILGWPYWELADGYDFGTEPYTVTLNGETIDPLMIFMKMYGPLPGADPLKVVTSMAITVDRPAAGKTPASTMKVTTVPAGGFTQSQYTANWFESTTANYNDSVPMTTATFEEGKYYFLGWPHDPGFYNSVSAGYELDPNMTATVNGESFSVYAYYIWMWGPLGEAGALNLKASNNANGIRLDWDPVTGAAKYKVEDAKKSKVLGTVTDLFYDDGRSLKMGTTYKYRVTALKSNGTELKNETVSIKFNPFRDVSLSDPSADYIAWAYNNAVVKGSVESDGYRYFNPNGSSTRMNFVMILWKMHGKPVVSGSNPFSDVSGTTSVNAVKWAVQKGIVKGTSATTFSPEQTLSRMNIIMILYKLAGSPKASTTTEFVDISGSKTIKAVNWAVKKGIITGVDATHFAPDSDCSRALLVEVLCKYNQNYPLI